jgi:hypothetical protein
MAYTTTSFSFEEDLERALNKGTMAVYIQTGADKIVNRYSRRIYLTYIPESYRYYLDHIAPVSKMLIEQKIIIVIEF